MASKSKAHPDSKRVEPDSTFTDAGAKMQKSVEGWQIFLLYLGIGWSVKPAFPISTRETLQIMETWWKRERWGSLFVFRVTSHSCIDYTLNHQGGDWAETQLHLL